MQPTQGTFFLDALSMSNYDLILSPGSKLVLYANDIHLIVSENDYTLLQRDMDALCVWSLLNLLSFNVKKYKSMTLSWKKIEHIPHQ